MLLKAAGYLHFSIQHVLPQFPPELRFIEQIFFASNIATYFEIILNTQVIPSELFMLLKEQLTP